MDASFERRNDAYRARVEAFLDGIIPAASTAPDRLHQAMRYAALNGGKRVRPLLVYAAGECLDVAPERLDPAAAAIEMIHAFSLIHDDLPAMDDDDLRRGIAAVHRRFDEATAILAGDALLPLAFLAIAAAPALADHQKVELACLIAEASGSLGMTGGQAIDLASEGRQLPVAELEGLHSLKTGALIRASVMSACCVSDDAGEAERDAMARFGTCIGLAFQIRDDLLDIEGETATIGKPAGSDRERGKATWPALFGIRESRARCDQLLDEARQSLQVFGDRAAPLLRLAEYMVVRAS